MYHRRRPIFALFLQALLPVLAFGVLSCGQLPCREDGTCVGGQKCDVATNTCAAPCATDDECASGERCVLPVGVCRQGESPQPQPSAVTPDPSCRGAVDCLCFSNGTCDWGARCNVSESSVCQDATGEPNQPCHPNNTCNHAAFACLTSGSYSVCRSIAQGGVGQECFPSIPGLSEEVRRCRSPRAQCREDFICLGGTDDRCTRDMECISGFCRGGRCTDAPDAGLADVGHKEDAGGEPDAGLEDASVFCRRRTECGVGQFCCGERGTVYFNGEGCVDALGHPVSLGVCFEAPASVYARPCDADTDCAVLPKYSPASTGRSLCMPWGASGAGVCSAPCEKGATDPGCPNGWQVEAAHRPCYADGDCALSGLTCVGANLLLGRPGRCRCGGASDSIRLPCTSSTASGAGLDGASCMQDGPNGDFFCTLTHHCAPPR